jgi:hypothetical protein
MSADKFEDFFAFILGGCIFGLQACLMIAIAQ